MKKPVSLHVQRVLNFIPLVNSLILFIWLYNFSCSNKEYRIWKKSLINIFCVSVPIAILQIVISKAFEAFPIVVTIVDFMALYMIPFTIGTILIKHQEEMIWGY